MLRNSLHVELKADKFLIMLFYISDINWIESMMHSSQPSRVHKLEVMKPEEDVVAIESEEEVEAVETKE